MANRSRRRIRPSRALVRLLGKWSDARLARRFSLSRMSVYELRRRRGIPPAFPRTPTRAWTAEELELLGTDTDRSVAAAIGRTPGSVQLKRRVLGIEAYCRTGFNEIEWTGAMLRCLGHLTDKEVARRFHISSTIVSVKRRSLGIKPKCGTPRVIRWAPEMLKLLGTMDDGACARALGVARSVVRRKRRELHVPALPRLLNRWKPEDLALLGSVTDRQLAPKVAVHRSYVARVRKRLGIPSLRAARHGKVRMVWRTSRYAKLIKQLGLHVLWRKRRAVRQAWQREGATRWTPEMLKLLGTMSDGRCAKVLGLTVPIVYFKRKELRIPAFPRLLNRWKPEHLALLGRVPDLELASKAGVHWGYVAWVRKQMGIPSFRKARQGEAKAAWRGSRYAPLIRRLGLDRIWAAARRKADHAAHGRKRT